MKFGVCASIDQAGIVKKAGFDFIECTVVSLRPEEGDDAVRVLLDKYHESPIPVEAFNILLPRDLKIVGENVDDDRVKRYLEKALERVKAVGGEMIVFGSGGSRTLPDGFSRVKGEEQILHFLNIIADFADPLGITIVIEPLNTTESNIINSVPEAVHFARMVNRKSIRVLADFYHMYKENEPLEKIVLYQEWIKHIHVSDSRYAPGMGDYPYETFVDCVNRGHYDARISIECLWSNFEQETAQSRMYLHRLFEAGR
ncbi:sugar phosphate isomerase/epimerase family protein [Paenibacillus solisilvae]|uniref:Sugar phosphate isomerase/epimerase family protein n=1 Tax=Paenibacillus solisilvae TaxID=2486751 RepID=A0ABW0W527_9BACL